MNDLFIHIFNTVYIFFQKGRMEYKKLTKAVTNSIGFLIYAACGASGMITKFLFGILSNPVEIDALSWLP